MLINKVNKLTTQGPGWLAIPYDILTNTFNIPAFLSCSFFQLESGLFNCFPSKQRKLSAALTFPETTRYPEDAKAASLLLKHRSSTLLWTLKLLSFKKEREKRDNRIYGARSNLGITAWNAHPGEVMRKMKHIWQNKTVARVTGQRQAKGQWRMSTR